MTERKVAAASAHEGSVGSSEGCAHAARRGNGKLKAFPSAALFAALWSPFPSHLPSRDAEKTPVIL